MTLADLRSRTLKRLDQDATTPAYFTQAEVTYALNEGQRLFAFLTLCLESTANLVLTPGTAFYTPRSSFANWLLPLRVYCAGAHVLPATINELDALDSTWRASTAAPSRYGSLGTNLLHFYGSTGTAAITYARMPAALASDGDVPEIPVASHPALIDYAISRVRAKQGGQEFGKTMPYFQRFLESVGEIAGFSRAKARAEQYDIEPYELTKPDLSSLIPVVKK